MSKPALQLLSLILSLFYIAGAADHFAEHTDPKKFVAEHIDPKKFVEVSCAKTKYPAACVQSLSGQAGAIGQDSDHLSRTAMTVGLAAAESTKADMLKLTNLKGLRPNEYGALKECLDQIEDGVDRLSQSVREMEQFGRPGSEELYWHKANVATSARAALTQMGICTNAFSCQALDGTVKDSVQGQVANVEQLIGNALSLFQ